MAVAKNHVVESRDSSAETLVEWVWRRPAMAIVLLVSALAVIIALLWYLTGGGNPGPKIDRSPWEGRKWNGGVTRIKPGGK